MKNLILIASSGSGFGFVSAKNLAFGLCLTAISSLYVQSAWSQANTELSNLVSPTKVNVNFLPTNDNNKNLGSNSKSWKDFYLDGYLYLDGDRWLANPGSDNTMVGKGAGTNTTGSDNTFIGKEAGVSNNIGNRNTFIGQDAGWQNTTGNGSVFIGADAGYHNSAGEENTFVGTESGFSNSGGTWNTAMGFQCFYSNSEGSFNSAFGTFALLNSTSGNYNAAFGNSAMFYNTTGSRNSAFGTNALTDNTEGDYNSAFGNWSLFRNISGDYNSALGNSALYNNRTGSDNTAMGHDALVSNDDGNNNAAVGSDALWSNESGNYNTAMGSQAGYGNTTANYGTFVGFDAGGSNTTGSQNTYLGYSTEGLSGAYTNVVGIGYQLTNTASNQARIGNSSTTSIGGWAGWSNVSDGRFKKNVKEDVSGLAFINKLRPVTYNLDVHAADVFVGKEFTEDHLTDASAKISEQAKSEKEKIIYSGFIAQEVEAAAKEIGYDFSGIDAPKNENDFYGLRYAEFVVPLVKAVQELDQENRELKTENGELQTELNDLRSRLERIESQLGFTGEIKQSSGNVNRATLEQNIPNPAKNTTTIGFHIPSEANNAQMIITDASGKMIQQFSNLMVGQSQVEISISHLSSGTYQYSLYVDGKKVDTKQMIISK